MRPGNSPAARIRRSDGVLLACVAGALAITACNDRVVLGGRDERVTLDGGGVHFSTLPPGSALPGGAACAGRVPRRGFEPRPENAVANRTTATGEQLAIFRADSWVAVDERARTYIRQRIDGAFTGTTDEIIAWAACKWGLEDDVMRAAAAVQSEWRQPLEGGVAVGDCPPGVTPAGDGSCPHVFGIFAVNYDAEASAHSTWPALRDSTAFNADYMGGFLRMCFERYVTWLDDPSVTPAADGPYVAGDVWECLGFASAGRWRNPEARAFTASVRDAYDGRPWTSASF
jgi:autotransporter family porin